MANTNPFSFYGATPAPAPTPQLFGGLGVPVPAPSPINTGIAGLGRGATPTVVDPQVQALINAGLTQGVSKKIDAINNQALIDAMVAGLGATDIAKFKADKAIKLNTAQLRDAAELLYNVPDGAFNKLSGTQLQNLFARSGKTNVDINQILTAGVPVTPSPGTTPGGDTEVEDPNAILPPSIGTTPATPSAIERAGQLYDLYAPGAKTQARLDELANEIQNTSFNRAKYNWLNRAGSDAELAAEFAANPAARAFARPEYDQATFTGLRGLDVNNPTLRNLPGRIAANVARSALSDTRMGGAVPMGTAGGVGIAAPEVYAGVPAAAARPNVNLSPEDYGALDVATRLAEARAAGYNDLYGNPVNTLDYRYDVEGRTPTGTPIPAEAAPAAAAPVGMKSGGIASLADDAESVRSAGRYGDDRLVHMNTEELGIMQGVLGKPTINPKTGLPEFFLGGLFKSIGKIFKKVISVAAKIVPFVAPFIPGIGPLTQAGIAGLSGAFSGGKFDLKRGLLSGLLSFGAGKLASGLQGAGKIGSVAADAADDVAAAGLQSSKVLTDAGLKLGADGVYRAPEYFTSAGQLSASALPQAGTEIVRSVTPGAGTTTEFITPTAQATQTAAQTATPSITEQISSSLSNLNPSNIAANIKTTGPQVLQGIKNLATNQPGAFEAFKNEFGQGSLAALGIGGTGLMALNEQEKFEEEQAALQEEERRRQRENLRIFRERTVPFEFSAAQGGEVDDEPGYDMARGGKVMPPRYLDGPGDGMSDSIKANIDGKRPARLADGEFVIPADVVSHLGNGSSKAGAKKLYSMMDRVRKARTGTTRQGREINPMRLMPA